MSTELEAAWAEVPDWLQVKDRTTLTVTTNDFRGSKTTEVTIRDIKAYYTSGHGMSGMRSLGSIDGDWRQIDGLAQICLDAFKVINPKALGLEAK